MFNMCNVHLLAVNKVQIQIIIEKTESGSEISSPSSLDKVIFETTKHRSANQRYTCCSHSGSEDDPDQNNFQKNFRKT